MLNSVMSIVRSKFVSGLLVKLGKKAKANPATTNFVTVVVGGTATYFGIDLNQVSKVLQTVATFLDKL